MARWHAARTRIQLKLAIQRVHMLQEKREALAKRARLHISELVGRGRMETARVKTESLILDDVRRATNRRSTQRSLSCLSCTAKCYTLDSLSWSTRRTYRALTQG